MEGDGPIMGRPKLVGMIAIGTDLPAVDATCARVMGLEPMRIPYLETAADFLGNVEASRIDQHGEPIARFRTNFDLIESMRSIRATS